MKRVLTFAILASLASAASGQWTELGPRHAGRVSAIAATDVSHLWVASPGGGVWKSADGGATFTLAANLGELTALNLAFDRNDPSRLYLRTWSSFLVSTDGGATWTRTLASANGDVANLFPSYFCSSWQGCPPFTEPFVDPGPYAQMVLSPTQSVILTALPCQGLQYSTDAGAHFTQLWPFSGTPPERNPDNCIGAIAADEVTHQVWIATANADGATHVYRSHGAWTAAGPPAGLTWDLVNAGLTSHAAVALAWGGTADRVMALVNTGGAFQAYLFNGTSWVAKPWNDPGCVFWDARALVWGGGNVFFAGGVTFAATADAGDHWACPALGPQYPDIRAVFALPSAFSVWIGGDQNQLGNYRLLTRYDWKPGGLPMAPNGITGTGITSWQAYTIAQGYGTGNLLVGAQDVASACSDDLGAHFQLAPTEEAQAIAWPRAGTGSIVYVYSTKGILQRSTDALAGCAAMTFRNVTPPDLRGQNLDGPHALAVHPGDPERVFLASGGTVEWSARGGTSWTASALPRTAAGFPPYATALFVDESGVLYVGTSDSGVYSCSDTARYCDGGPGSGTWKKFALNPGGAVTPPSYVTAIAESNSPRAPRTFWITTSQGVYRRRPGETAWQAVSPVPGYPYSDVVVDPSCRSRVYIGVGYLGDALRTRGGILVSNDEGATWSSLTLGMPLHNVPVTQLLVDAAHPERLFATTYGRGAWSYTWPSLPACTP